MSTILTLILSLVLILAGPEFLWAKAKTAAKSTQSEASQSIQELETATTDLKDNTKDLRRNITSWRKIQWDPQLTPAQKKTWRGKASTYLQECEAYSDLLNKVDAKKLPKSEVSRRFLTERKIFQSELQSFRETLKKP